MKYSLLRPMRPKLHGEFGQIFPSAALKSKISKDEILTLTLDRGLTRHGQDDPATGGATRAGWPSLAEAIIGMGYPMDASIAPRFASPSESSTNPEAPRLSKRASLLLVLALSLGLWAAIWAAVASLASVMVG